jgi:hypothetical protein
MKPTKRIVAAAAALCATVAYGADPAKPVDAHKLSSVTVGISTKAQVRALLGSPWRIVQFNDCGMALPGQADETWEYRGRDSDGGYRFHVEFNDRGVAHLVARIPDVIAGGVATRAKVSAEVMAHNHPM